MDRKMLALSLLLLSISPLFAAADANPFCPLNPTPSYLDIILEPPKGPGSIIATYVYNISKEDYVKNGLPYALIIMVNQTNKSDTRLCYEYADSDGWANFKYDSTLDGCTDYWFIFCPHSDAIGGSALQTAARQTCLNGTGLPSTLVSLPITQACNNGGSAGGLALANYLPSHNQFYMCSAKPKSYGGLCWPIMLMFAVLVGANFLMGKNPFLAFDFSAMRMSRGRQYTMRQQQKSMDATSLVMALDKASSTASGGKGSLMSSLTGAIKGAVASSDEKADQKVNVDKEGNMLNSKGEKTGLKVDANGTVTDAVSGKATGDKVDADGKVVDSKNQKVSLNQAIDNAKKAELGSAQALGQRGMIATATAPDLLNALVGIKELYNVIAGKEPSETGKAMEARHAALFGTDKNENAPVSGGALWGRLFSIVADKFKGMLRVTDNGKLDIGNMIKSALSMYMIYKTVAEYQRTLRAGPLGGGSKVAGEKIFGVDMPSNLSVLGRNMSIGEVADWVANPNGMPYLLAPLAPALDVARDFTNLQLTGTPPPGVMAAAKEFDVENKKYAVIRDTDGNYVVFGSDGKHVTGEKEKSKIIAAIGGAEGYEKNKTMAYLRVDTEGVATRMDKGSYENLCLRLEEWNDAKNKMRRHVVEGLAARLNADEQGALGRIASLLGPGAKLEDLTEKMGLLLEKKNLDAVIQMDGSKLSDGDKALCSKILGISMVEIEKMRKEEPEKFKDLSERAKKVLATMVGTDVDGLRKMGRGDIAKVLEFTKKVTDGEVLRFAQGTRAEGGLQILFQIQTLNLAMQMTERQSEVLRENRGLVSEKGKLDNETFAQIQGNDVLYRYYVNKEAEQSQLQDVFRGRMPGGALFTLIQNQEKTDRDNRIAVLEKDIEKSKGEIEEKSAAAKRSDTPAASKLAFEKEIESKQAEVEGMQKEQALLKFIGNTLGAETKNVAMASSALMSYAMALHRQNALEAGLISEARETGLADRDVIGKLILASTTGASSQFMDVTGEKAELRSAMENLNARQSVFSELRERMDRFGEEHGMNHLAAMGNARGEGRKAEIAGWGKDTSFLFREASKALSAGGDWMDFKIASNYVEAGKSEKEIPAIGNSPESRYMSLIESAQARMGALISTIDEKDGKGAYKGSALKPEDVKAKIQKAMDDIKRELSETLPKHSTDQNHLEQLSKLAITADNYASNDAVRDEKRMSEYSEEGVRKARERAELDVWHSTPYLQHPAGSALNQARGGGYFNVENDLISFFERATFGLISAKEVAVGVTALATPLTVLTFGLIPLPEMSESTAKYDKDKVFQGALLGSSVWAPVPGPSAFSFSFDKWVPKEEAPKAVPQPTTEYFQGFRDLTTISQFSTLNYQTNVPVAQEEKVAWFGGLKKLTMEAQMTKATDSGRFMDSAGVATAEQTGNFLQHQLVLNSKTQAYDIRPADSDGFVVDDRGQHILDSDGKKIRGYTDSQVGVWMLHNTTNTIRVYSSKVDFADAEFKTALSLDAVKKAATPEARAEALMEYAATDEGRARLIKDQDLKHNVITTNDDGEKTTRRVSMNKADKEWTGERIDKVVETYQGWQQSRQPTSTTTTAESTPSAKQEAQPAEIWKTAKEPGIPAAEEQPGRSMREMPPEPPAPGASPTEVRKWKKAMDDWSKKND